MGVSDALIDLMNAATAVRVAVPIEQAREVDQLMCYLREQNGLHGPAYMIGGRPGRCLQAGS